MAFNIQGAMQAGYTPEEIQAYLKSKNTGQATLAINPTPQETLPKSQGFDWTNFLPLVGAVGGSFIPGLGTILGGMLGAGGGALAKQVIKGQGDAGEVAKEAALAGIGGGVGKGIGWGLGKVLPGILGKVGEGAVASQYNVPRNVARAIKFPGSVGTLADKYGVTSIEDVAKIAPEVTGSNGIVSQLTRRAVAKAQPVELGSYTTAVGEVPSVIQLADELTMNPSISANTGSKFIKFIEKGVQQSMGGQAGNITGKANPSEVFEFIQQLEKSAAGVTRGRAPTAITAEDQALASAYKSMADELSHRLFAQSGANQAVTGGLLTAEELASLSKLHPQLAKDIAGAKTVSELRSIAAPFVQANQAAAETTAASQYGLQNMAGQAKGLGKLVQNPLNLLAMPLSSNTVNSGIGKAALAGSKLAKKIPLPSSQALERAGIASGVGLGASPGQVTGGANATLTSMGQNQPDATLASAKTPEEIKQDTMKQLFFLMMLKNPKQAATLKAMYEFGFPTPKVNDRAASLQTGINTVDQALKGVGGFGPITGRAYELGLKVGGGAGVPEEAVRLQTQYQLLRQNIVRSFQGARMSDKDIETALQYTPSITDTPATARTKLKSLRQLIVNLTDELKGSPSVDSSIPQPNNFSL